MLLLILEVIELVEDLFNVRIIFGGDISNFLWEEYY